MPRPPADAPEPPGPSEPPEPPDPSAPAGSVLRRLTGFTLLPLLALVTPFLLLPVVARVAGPAGWSSFVAGQSIGTVGATVVFWGWNVGGPVAVARAGTGHDRAQVYGASLRTRLVLLAVVVPAVVVVSAVVADPGHRLDAAAMGAATSLLGMSPSWFGIGVGQPLLLFWYDTVPRVVAALVGAPLVWVTGAVWLYPLLLALSVVISLWAFHRHVETGAGRRGAVDWRPWPARRSVGELREHLGTAGINLAATAYASTPVPVVTAAFRPQLSSPFASADAAYRLGLFTVTAMGNAFQGWTLEADLPADRQRGRHWRAVASHAALGAVGGLAFALLGPWVTGLLFGAAVAAPADVCAYYGLSFLFISASSPAIRNLLIPAGRERLVLGWTVASGVFGLGLMGLAVLAQWSAGVALGMAVSEAVLLLGLAVPAVHALRDLGRDLGRDPQPAP